MLQTLLQKLRIWPSFSSPSFLNPIVFQRKFNPSVSASSKRCCFVRAIWCHKAWWVSTKPLASQQKAIDLSLQGINETRTSGILDLTDLYHISRVSFLKSISIGNCSPTASLVRHFKMWYLAHIYLFNTFSFWPLCHK